MKSWEEISLEYEQELEQLRALNKALAENGPGSEQEVKEEQTIIQKTEKNDSGDQKTDTAAGNKKDRKRDTEAAGNKLSAKGRVSAVVSNLIFYGAIALLLFAVVAVTSGDNSSGSVLGHRYYHVLTSSMNSVYPKGSIVIVKEKGDYEIQIGDDITFYTDPNTSVTHRVVDIIEDYDDNGARGYQTQGTENLNPDPDINHEENVVGKVVYCIPKLGSILELAKKHMVFIFILFIAAVVISLLVRMIAVRRRQEKELLDSEKEWTIIQKQETEGL